MLLKKKSWRTIVKGEEVTFKMTWSKLHGKLTVYINGKEHHSKQVMLARKTIDSFGYEGHTFKITAQTEWPRLVFKLFADDKEVIPV